MRLPRWATLATVVASVVVVGTISSGPGLATGLAEPMSPPMSAPVVAPVNAPNGTVVPPSPASQQITFSPLPVYGPMGTTVALAATASSGLTVIYTSMTLTKCKIDGTTLVLLDMGLCVVTASQPGSGFAWSPAPPVTLSMDITPPEPGR